MVFRGDVGDYSMERWEIYTDTGDKTTQGKREDGRQTGAKQQPSQKSRLGGFSKSS